MARPLWIALAFIALMAGEERLSYGDIIFTLGNIPSNEKNILLTSGATGTTVTGTPIGFTNLTVVFTSSQALAVPSSGQARITAASPGTPLTNLSISLANGGTYGDLVFNPFIGGLCPNCSGGAAIITVNALSSSGMPEAPFVFTGLNIANGNNFVTITASGGEQIMTTSISVPGGFEDLRQPRISAPMALRPEPSTLLLVSMGYGLLAIVVRRRIGRSIRGIFLAKLP